MEREVQRMTEETLLKIKEAEVDVEGALARFCGNSALYEKFLGKFLQDDNFKKIGDVEAGDSQEMLMAAHTLKGVAGNLGLNGLMKACAEMVVQLRSNSMEGALAAYPAVKEYYGKVCEAINSMEGIGG